MITLELDRFNRGRRVCDQQLGGGGGGGILLPTCRYNKYATDKLQRYRLPPPRKSSGLVGSYLNGGRLTYLHARTAWHKGLLRDMCRSWQFLGLAASNSRELHATLLPSFFHLPGSMFLWLGKESMLVGGVARVHNNPSVGINFTLDLDHVC